MTREQLEDFLTAPPFERTLERWPDDPLKHAWPGQYKAYDIQLAWECVQEAERLAKEEKHELQEASQDRL